MNTSSSNQDVDSAQAQVPAESSESFWKENRVVFQTVALVCFCLIVFMCLVGTSCLFAIRISMKVIAEAVLDSQLPLPSKAGQQKTPSLTVRQALLQIMEKEKADGGLVVGEVADAIASKLSIPTAGDNAKAVWEQEFGEGDTKVSSGKLLTEAHAKVSNMKVPTADEIAEAVKAKLPPNPTVADMSAAVKSAVTEMADEIGQMPWQQITQGIDLGDAGTFKLLEVGENGETQFVIVPKEPAK